MPGWMRIRTARSAASSVVDKASGTCALNDRCHQPSRPNSAVPEVGGALLDLRVWPSPTTGPATIAFDLPDAAPVEVEVFDVGGRLVQRIDLGELGAGGHQVPWDGSDLAGADVANGVYMVRVVSEAQLLASERLVVAR